jgi:lactoylglutathione lyase
MKINLIVLKTAQPGKLVRFYQQLGMNFEEHRHGNGPLHFAAEINDVVFEIYSLSKESGPADNTLRLGFTVSKLDHLVENLQRSGVKIIRNPTMTEWGYQALIEDPDGRKIELKDEVIAV